MVGKKEKERVGDLRLNASTWSDKLRKIGNWFIHPKIRKTFGYTAIVMSIPRKVAVYRYLFEHLLKRTVILS